MYQTIKNQTGSHTKIKTTKDRLRLQVIYRSGKLFVYVLSKLTKAHKIHMILLEKEDISYGLKYIKRYLKK